MSHRALWIAASAAAAFAIASFAASPPPAAAPGTRLVGWNNLGMHCMDADYSVFSLLPPYNTVHAQLVRNGVLVKSDVGIAVTYEAVVDAAGSINTTSSGKTNFWTHVQDLFGVGKPVDTGLTGNSMPGAANTPRAMTWDSANSWWIAEGIPLTPTDDAGAHNPYPMMRLVARDASQNVVATTDVVLPVSDEMSCRTCHASGSPSGAQPVAGWVGDLNPERDYRLNILRKHDEAASFAAAYPAALAAHGYSAAGLYATAISGKAVLCAGCHASNALGTTGFPNVPALTMSVHSRHGSAIDPTNGLALAAVENRAACYRCHPGSTTRCLRGAMGNSVAPDGTMAMQCQSCHGSMYAVGSPGRQGWLDEPTCQSCHTGTAVSNNGQIRYTDAFDAGTAWRVAADATFATTPDAPMAGVSLFRFSRGHGGLACEACHGSTHAEFPSSHANDNVQSLGVQGHVGMLVECAACHGQAATSTNGGPHGMHTVGQAWVSRHGDLLEGGNGAKASSSATAPCMACHGQDLKGTVLSKAQADRTLSGKGVQKFFKGSIIGCWACHAGPTNGDSNPSVAPTASDASASTIDGTSVMIQLVATDKAQSVLTYRIVSQAAHGTVGLLGSRATYFPEPGFVGADTFTFAARDGFVDSNLATVQVTVGSAPPTADFKARWLSVTERRVGRKWRLDLVLAVANVGAVNAPKSLVRIGSSLDGFLHSGDVTLKALAVKPLKIGQERRMKFSVPLASKTALSGAYVIAVANSDGAVPQANKANDMAVFGPMP